MAIRMRRALCLAALPMFLGSCVTINIYFPAAAAERAADKIIDEVWQLKNGRNASKKPEPSGGQTQH